MRSLDFSFFDYNDRIYAMNTMKRLLQKRIFMFAVMFTVFSLAGFSSFAKPDDEDEKISKITEEKEKNEEKLDEINGKLEDLAALSEETRDELDEANDALVSLLAEIEVLEDQIDDKEIEIEVATDAYNEALDKATAQYEAMKIRIRYLYETGNTDILEIYASTGSFSEAVTKADYVEDLYSYDRKMLLEYQDTVEEVIQLKSDLEAEMDELLLLNDQYEEEKQYTEGVVEELKSLSDTYMVELSAAKNQAAKYAAIIKRQNKEITDLEKEKERKRKEEEARKEKERKALEEAKKKEKAASANKAEDNAKDTDETGTDETGTEESKGQQEADEVREEGNATNDESGAKYDVSSIYNASGSDTGKSIAAYACKFIGNPYVPGGTSLTKGADCSGFVYSVYKDFGYSVPRTSYSLKNAGKEVSYSEAEPGDVICYPGHVAIYLGNGMIVHASTQKTGIKISNAQYRGILCVRRLI